MMKKYVFPCLFLLFCTLAVMAANKSSIAIFDFRNVRGGESTDGQKLSMLLFADLSGHDNISLVERQELDKLIKERQLRSSGLTAADYKQLAALVNADYIITGRIFSEGEEMVINLKLTRCSDGRIFGRGLFINASSANYLATASNKAAGFIIGKLRKLSESSSKEN